MREPLNRGPLKVPMKKPPRPLGTPRLPVVHKSRSGNPFYSIMEIPYSNKGNPLFDKVNNVAAPRGSVL